MARVRSTRCASSSSTNPTARSRSVWVSAPTAHVETELGERMGEPALLERGRERLEQGRGLGDRGVAVVVDQRQQGLGQAGQVPQRDGRLVAVGVATAVVDRAEHRRRVERLHEGTRPVVDRLAGDRHVVGVHHAVDEPDQHPPGDQVGLGVGHRSQQRQVRPFGLGGGRVVALDRVVGEAAHELGPAVGRRVLERADAQVTRSDADQHRAGQHRVTGDLVAGGDHRERLRGRDVQGLHRLAHEVLAQHRADRCETVAAAGEGCPPGPLELQVAAPAVGRRPPRRAAAPDRRPAAASSPELVPGVGLSHGLGPVRHRVADQDRDPGRAAEVPGVGAQLGCEPVVQGEQLGIGRRSGLPGHVELGQLPDEGVVETEQGRSGDGHRREANGASCDDGRSHGPAAPCRHDPARVGRTLGAAVGGAGVRPDRGTRRWCRVVWCASTRGASPWRWCRVTSGWWSRRSRRVAWSSVTSARSTPMPDASRSILARRTVFERRSPGVSRDELRLRSRAVAANMDVVLVLQPLDPGVNTARLARELVLAWESGATPVVVLTKADLMDRRRDRRATRGGTPVRSRGRRARGVAAERRRPGRAGRPRSAPPRVVALLGASGAGKSTLVNALAGRAVQLTAEVRDSDRRGRHTTSAGQMVELRDGSLLIDTPGIRGVGLWSADEGIERAFDDLTPFVQQCRFDDCTHTDEPGCGLVAAIDAGEIGADRVEVWRVARRRARRARGRPRGPRPRTTTPEQPAGTASLAAPRLRRRRSGRLRRRPPGRCGRLTTVDRRAGALRDRHGRHGEWGSPASVRRRTPPRSTAPQRRPPRRGGAPERAPSGRSVPTR